jgi:hypothetical protein
MEHHNFLKYDAGNTGYYTARGVVKGVWLLGLPLKNWRSLRKKEKCFVRENLNYLFLMF